MAISRKELISKYLEFFKKKDHKVIPNSPLVPENDPTVLFTTAGMHPLVPYLLGQKHPLGKNLVSIQKCLRTDDIDEVGDNFHHTFFEMLGNWSLGDYWKKQAIEYSYEFLTKILKLDKNKFAITCFAGDKDAKKDQESAKIWLSAGIPKNRIFFLGKKENWWGPAGKIGPCGPDTEIFFWSGKDKPSSNIKNPGWSEIWNDVFMQYNKTKAGKFESLKQKNVDTGMGVERTLAVLNNLDDDYLTECFFPIIKEIEKISKKKYGKNKQDTRAMRIIADHLKAAVFILSEKIAPSNVEQGYIARRLIRRAIRYGKIIMMQNNFTKQIAEIVIKIYLDYPELQHSKQFILGEIEKEEKRFRQVLASGLKFFNKISHNKKQLSGKDVFLLYQSYGFPIEMTQELAKEKNMKVNISEYEKELKKHQELSRTAAKGRFKSGLADQSQETTKLHTATHLLHEALRKILGKHIEQRGSNITAERLRLDFSHPQKLTKQELKKVEEEVNKKIKQALPIKCEEMTVEQAKKKGAQALFTGKYGEKIKVYSIGNYSIEICTGPHVKNTKDLGKFKIIKEESVSAGVRRIKAKLE